MVDLQGFRPRDTDDLDASGEAFVITAVITPNNSADAAA
jgi:hypothetical protein